MRAFVQFQAIGGDTIYALDEDGILFVGTIGDQMIKQGGAYECDWTAIAGPADDEPFVDRRSRLDIIEETIREAEKQREALLGETESKTDPGGAGA